MLGAYAMKRIAAIAHLPTSWLLEPVKRPDDTAHYCPDGIFLHKCKHKVLVFTVEWTGARHEGAVVRVQPNLQEFQLR